jgi:hypothetical protein
VTPPIHAEVVCLSNFAQTLPLHSA